jgi:hypothetical protein
MMNVSIASHSAVRSPRRMGSRWLFLSSVSSWTSGTPIVRHNLPPDAACGASLFSRPRCRDVCHTRAWHRVVTCHLSSIGRRGRRYGRTSRSRSRATSMPSRARSARTLSCFLRAPNVVARYDRIRSSTAHLAACGFSIEMGVSEICASSTARLRMRLEIVMDFTRSLKSVLSRSTARSILSPAARHAREARYSQWTSAGHRMWVGDLDSASSVGLTGSGLGYFQQRRWPTLRNVGTPNFTDSQ